MIERKIETFLHIISEPGDATRYDYGVFRTGPDDFSFMPIGSTFRFPQRLNFYDVCDIVSVDQCTEMAEAHGCNAYTLFECIRRVKELHVSLPTKCPF